MLMLNLELQLGSAPKRNQIEWGIRESRFASLTRKEVPLNVFLYTVP